MRIIRRPSPALVLSILALVVAVVGSPSARTFAAIAHKISGSSLKRHSVAGNRLKNNTVTGKQIKESSLGTVPMARSAKSASTLSGIPASGFVRPIDVRVTKPVNTGGVFGIAALPGLGEIDGECTTIAGVILANTTSQSQDVSVTFTDETSDGSGSKIYDFHGPLAADSSVSHAVPVQFSADIEGLTDDDPPKGVRATVLAYSSDGICTFDVIGEGTL